MITVWIGYDRQFEANIPVETQSVSRHARSVSIKYLHLDKIKELTRPRDPHQTTDSAFTRWMIPYLAGYKGWHLYLDSDMMVCDNLEELWRLTDDSKAVMVVKHADKHQDGTKFNGQLQSNYPRKNWSSVILFNAEKCRTLTPEYVNQAPGLDLHQFKWLPDGLIGELPPRWNHLVGIDSPDPNPGIIHWTLGGPWFSEYANVEHAEKWRTL